MKPTVPSPLKPTRARSDSGARPGTHRASGWNEPTAIGAERTTILAITVPDLLPASGPVQIAYVIGFRSRQLVQVTVTFGGAANPQLTPPVAVDLARMLQTHLVGVGYKPDTVAVNLAQPDGTIVVFRGDDAQGRRAIAALIGVAAVEGQRPAAVPTLQVSYIRDPQNPDVFQIRKGDF